ncbi:hypothetical protein Ddc_15461 [Ditylenchus destructor]|nr:hypothetical protein Ddc_15461 [Ditylenchus destructor]
MAAAAAAVSSAQCARFGTPDLDSPHLGTTPFGQPPEKYSQTGTPYVPRWFKFRLIVSKPDPRHCLQKRKILSSRLTVCCVAFRSQWRQLVVDAGDTCTICSVLGRESCALSTTSSFALTATVAAEWRGLEPAKSSGPSPSISIKTTIHSHKARYREIEGRRGTQRRRFCTTLHTYYRNLTHKGGWIHAL